MSISALKKIKIIGLLLAVLCIVVLVVLSWPRKLARMIPSADQVSSVYIFWSEAIGSAEEVELTGEQVDTFLGYWEEFDFRPTTAKSIMVAPTYHVYFITESEHINMWISAEGVVQVDEKFYYAKPWNAQAPAELKDFILGVAQGQ